MSVHNQVILNAAIAGFAAGSLDSTPQKSAASGAYNGLANAASAFGNAVDQAIPHDTALYPSSVFDEYTAARCALVQSLSQGAAGNSFNKDSTQADYNTIAAAIAEAYADVATKFG